MKFTAGRGDLSIGFIRGELFAACLASWRLNQDDMNKSQKIVNTNSKNELFWGEVSDS